MDGDTKPWQAQLALAGQLESKEPVLAYHLRLHVVQTAMEARSAGVAAPRAFVSDLMGGLETSRQHLEATLGAGALDEEKVRPHLLAYVGRLFKAADDTDRAGAGSITTARQFYAASTMLDVAQRFEQGIPLEMADMRKYARWRAAELSKVGGPSRPVDRQEVPRAEPNPSQDIPPAFTLESLQQLPIPPTQAPFPAFQPNSTPHLPSNPGPQPATVQYNPPNSAPVSLTGTGGAIATSPEALQKAQKHAKFAVSALEFDDVAYAIQNLEAALRLLKP